MVHLLFAFLIGFLYDELTARQHKEYFLIVYAGSEVCGRFMLGLPVLLPRCLLLAMVSCTLAWTRSSFFLPSISHLAK